MKAASEDFKDILVAGAIGTFATDIFIGTMPALPDANITLRDTGGLPPELNYELEEPGVQLLIRGAKGAYVATEAKAKAAYSSLQGLNNYTINAARYLIIAGLQTPIYVGNDKLNRPLFSINFETKRTTA